MADSPGILAVHTEHILLEVWVSQLNTQGVRLFRAPTVLDGSGDRKRLPHEVALEDLRENDLILALQLEGLHGNATVFVLQFWHVLEAKEGEARVRVNSLVGECVSGEHVYDRLAGMVGMPPSDPTRNPGG